MAWGKCVIISLGLMLMTHVAQARDIDTFTDSRGTLHITNLGSKKPGSPANSPSPAARFRPGSSPGDAADLWSGSSTRPAHLPNPAASLPPGNLPGPTPATLPGLELAPAVQAPGPLAKAASAEPVSADPQPGPVPAVAIPADQPRGPLVSQAPGSSGVMRVAHRTGGQDEPGGAAGVTRASLQRLSWTPPEPVQAAANGSIVLHRDRQGVMHITNVPVAEPSPAGPLIPAALAGRRGPPPEAAVPGWQMASCPVPGPVIRKQARPPGATLPTVRQASCPVPVQKRLWPPGPAPPAVEPAACPELGPEVANYLEAKLLAQAPALTGQTIQRYQDHRGVWHIRNEASPDLQLSEVPLAAATGPVTMPASAQGPPGTGLAWGAGRLRPPPGAGDRTVVARRDRRGIVHIFAGAAPEASPDQGSPLSFLGKISPVLQACIVEAAQQYRLPISLVLAIIRKESDFSHQAVSPKGAMGLMQLMPGTAAALGVRDPFDPRENILAGCRYFRSLLDSFQGNVPLALAGYNAGSHRVISAGYQVPAIHETQAFVTQVMGLYYLLEKQADSL